MNKSSIKSIVVVGNGMVGLRFCERLISQAQETDFTLTVVGEENVPAYDRVNLSRYAETHDAESLILRPPSWYEEKGITCHLGSRVTALHPEKKCITLDDEREFNYDELILATGSRPFIPDVPGHTHSKVFPYRTLEDVKNITAAAEHVDSAVVIGGGLLGLEAAEFLMKSGVNTSVIQLGDFLMSAQLNAEASSILRKKVEESGIKVFTNKRTMKFEGDEQVKLFFEDGTDHSVDMVVISAGIIPNTEIAEAAGIHCGVRGGVIIDNKLQSSEPHIYAIGECALHQNQIYGLVAPGYEMAEALADRFCGNKKATFLKGDLSTRLKMVGVDVVTIGDYLDPRGEKLVYQSDHIYRIIALGRRGHVIGGMAVGVWNDASAVQYLRDQKGKLSKAQKALFLKEGTLGEGNSLDVSSWPDKQLICNCLKVSKGQICAAMNNGADSCAKLKEATGASSVCGSCEPLLHSIVTGGPVVQTSSKPWLSTVSLIALIITCVAILFSMPTPQSVETLLYKVDELWRNTFYKQVTGYVVASISVIGSLMSLRKRVSWLKSLGKFASWRLFHTVFGLVSLLALFSHTGFRFGENLNFWLMLTFIGLNLLGAIAGIASGLEANALSKAGVIARRFRPVLTYAHIILFWPFPILLTFHILKSYHW